MVINGDVMLVVNFFGKVGGVENKFGFKEGIFMIFS